MAERAGKRSIVFVAIAIAVVAILMAVLFSGFSTGSIGTTLSNPFGPGEGLPVITMTIQEREYEGELLGYVWGERTSFSELPEVNRENLTSVSFENTANVRQGSEIRFSVSGNPPPESPLDSLSVTVFTEDGEPVTVLDAQDGRMNNTYSTGGLEAAEYILVSTATWYPDERREIVTGYVAYGHRINITGPADT